MTVGWSVFEAVNPLHAATLSCMDITQGGALEKEYTLQKEETLFDARTSKKRYLHSRDGAFLEAQAWVIHTLESIKEKVEVLVIYGVGLGWYWKALLPWLERKKERRIFVIEDDLAIIGHFLDSQLADSFFSHPQTRLIALSGPEDKESLDLLSWNLFRKKYLFLSIPPYLQYRPNAVKIIKDALFIRALDIQLVGDEFLTFGIQHARNWLRNLSCLKKSYNAQDLFQKFQGLPIITVAAGPSLQDAIPFLKKWQHHVLILAGGSAINALLEFGITPHLCLTVDPNPLQYNRMKYLEPFQLPLIFRSRALFEGVAAAKGNPLLYLKGGDGYPFISYCEEMLGIQGDTLDGGDSVATLSIEFAAALGASSIIMIGYDLGYIDGKKYASSMQSLLHKSEGGIAISSKREQTTVTARSNAGNIIYTEAKWMLEGKWISLFARQVKDSVQIINTSFQGLQIEHVDVMELDTIETMLINKKNEDILPHLFTALYSCTHLGEKVSSDSISTMLKKISDSLILLEPNLEKLLHLFEPNSSSYNKEEAETLFYNVESSFAFQNLLQPFWTMHTVWSEMKMRLEFPRNDEEVDALKEKEYIKSSLQRLHFMLAAIYEYQKLFFSYVSWAILQGESFSDPLLIAPWPKGSEEKESYCCLDL